VPEGFAAVRKPTPIKKTSSDVATAHAELDSVLPPSGKRVSEKVPRFGSDAPPEVTPVTVVQQPVAPPAPPEPPTPAPQETQVPVPTASPPTKPYDQADEPEVTLAVAAPPVAEESVEEIATAAPAEPPATEGSEEPSIGEEPVDSIGPITQSASTNPLPRVMAVANQKGGVGKTTTSVNLGAALAELGFRVLVIDLDPQGNATTGLGVDARNFELSMYDVLMRDASLEDCVEPTSMKNLFVAPATIALAGAEIELVPAFSRELKLKKSIESILGEFDYVLIDCPPSLGLITVNALAAADEVLVPIQCEYYALEGLSQLMRNVHLVASNLNPKLDISTIVLTMYDARTKLADQVANEVRQHFGPKVCRSVIPRTVRLSEAPSFGQPITAFDPSSRGAIAYRELAKEVSGGTS
jgi:chromosome partitioning protein